MRELLKNMFELQSKLNDHTNGIGWRGGYTEAGKAIDWGRCIRGEVIELIDSGSWKHWKNITADTNWDNIILETVDLWHFVMSDLMVLHNIDEVIPAIELCKPVQPRSVRATYMEVVEYAEKLADATRNGHDATGAVLISVFFNLLDSLCMDIPTLYKAYVVKNTLNKFRNNNGYAAGTYIKIINGDEDNVIINKLMVDNPTFTPDELYDAYDVLYISHQKQK